MAAEKNGFALVAVLWLVVLLSMVATGFISTTRGHLALTQNLSSNVRLKAAADGGVNVGILHLVNGAKNEIWSADSKPVKYRIDDINLEISIIDEAALVDLNNASEHLLERVLQAADLREDQRLRMAKAISDWRDRDGKSDDGESELKDYKLLNLAYGPKNDTFVSIDELGQIPGFTPFLTATLRPFLTVHSGLQGVDPNVVSGDLFKLLDLEGEDGKRGRASGGAMSATGKPVMRRSLSASTNSVFTIRVRAYAAGQGEFTRHATVKLTGQALNPYHIVDWRSGKVEKTKEDLRGLLK